MCAHGKSGFRDLILGSIAQQVLAGSLTPLLLLQPKSAQTRTFAIRRILLPLDSESIHDDSLPYAERLAKPYGAEVYLLTVIPTLGTLTGEKAAVSVLLPTTTTAVLNIKEETAKEHLQVHLDQLLKASYKAKAEIARGDPAAIIVSTAEHIEADLILLSTHLKAGMNAFWARSVAPNLARRTRIPILFIPLPEKED